MLEAMADAMTLNRSPWKPYWVILPEESYRVHFLAYSVNFSQVQLPALASS